MWQIGNYSKSLQTNLSKRICFGRSLNSASSNLILTSYNLNDLAKRQFVSNLKNNGNIKISNHSKIKSLVEKITEGKIMSPEEINKFINKQVSELKSKFEEVNQCIICQSEFYTKEELISGKADSNNVILFSKCKNHFFHVECAQGFLNSNQGFIQCPICKQIYGIKQGNMPPGKMTIGLDQTLKCHSFENVPTIVITYSFQGGNMNGIHYPGRRATCYLPYTSEGIKLAKKLRVAFDRKLTFTIGTSITTGSTNVIVWNGIHHKTRTSGGATQHGFPDSTYFERLREELTERGISEESIQFINIGI